jgi:hypothetical protein
MPKYLIAVAMGEKVFCAQVGNSQPAGEGSQFCQFSSEFRGASDIEITALLGIVVVLFRRHINPKVEVVGCGKESLSHSPITLTEAKESFIRSKG